MRKTRENLWNKTPAKTLGKTPGKTTGKTPGKKPVAIKTTTFIYIDLVMVITMRLRFVQDNHNNYKQFVRLEQGSPN